MTADSQELRTAQSLRKLADGVEAHSRSGRFGFGGGMVLDAADLRLLLSANEALARENERLREALKPFANAVGLGGYDDQVVVELSSGPLTRGQFRAARQALEPSLSELG